MKAGQHQTRQHPLRRRAPSQRYVAEEWIGDEQRFHWKVLVRDAVH